MAKKGPKIKELAVELGVTARRIVDRCREEGIVVQNSVTRLDLEAADRVRGWFANRSNDDDAHAELRAETRADAETESP